MNVRFMDGQIEFKQVSSHMGMMNNDREPRQPLIVITVRMFHVSRRRLKGAVEGFASKRKGRAEFEKGPKKGGDVGFSYHAQGFIRSDKVANQFMHKNQNSSYLMASVGRTNLEEKSRACFHQREGWNSSCYHVDRKKVFHSVVELVEIMKITFFASRQHKALFPSERWKLGERRRVGERDGANEPISIPLRTHFRLGIVGTVRTPSSHGKFSFRLHLHLSSFS